jgi:lipopolysaccharide/colanic/teichoic acid biosynthesis glycosyltransferase
MIDIIIAVMALPFFLLAFIVVAPFILLEDGRPIFYNAERIGKDGKIFKMYKFRSMKNNAPDIRLADGSTYNGEDDPRVTKVGKILRKTSVDELPQILNILKGDMSLIGPRPDPTDWLEKYPPEVKVFLEVRPGITGYSQAYFRNSADGETKMKNDVYYAQNCSFWLDVKIFFKTIAVVLEHENTYKDTSLEANQLDDSARDMLDKIQ